MKKPLCLSILAVCIVLLLAFTISADFYVIPAKNSSGSSIPSGGIIMWSGSIATIPDGWSLCDGSNGTPDLRNRFIVGAGGGGILYYAVHETGGEVLVTLTTDQIPSHQHTLTSQLFMTTGGQPYGNCSGNCGLIALAGQSTNATGGGEAHENRPPYYALAYIMKL